MRIKSTFSVVACLLPALLWAQPDTAWVRIYSDTLHGGDEAHAIAVDDSGNAYVAGCCLGRDPAFLAIKYLPSGEMAWARMWNPTQYDDEPNATVLDHHHNLITTGYSNGATGTSGDWATIKLSPGGESLWARTYDYDLQDVAHALAVDDSDDVCVVGELGTFPALSYGVIKYSPAGETLWTRRYSAGGSMPVNRAEAVTLDRRGDAIVTGFSGLSGNIDVATVKYGRQGDTAWVRRYDDPSQGSDYGYSVAVDSAGSIYVAGCSYYSGKFHMLVVRYNAAGDTIWSWIGPGGDADQITALTLDRVGDGYAVGIMSNASGHSDIATAKFRPNGDTVWTARYNATGYGDESGRAVAVDAAGNVYVAGQSLNPSGGYNAVTLEYDSLGHLLWVGRYPGPSNWSDARAVALDPEGRIAVGGKASTPDGYGGALTIMYGANGGAVEREPLAAHRLPLTATITRGVLMLRAGSRQKAAGRAELLDIMGRKALDLHPGPNDVSRLAPGVYFMTLQLKQQAQAVSKIIVAR